MTDKEYKNECQKLINKLKPILVENYSDWNWKWDQEYRESYNTLACTTRFSHPHEIGDIVITMAYYKTNKDEKIRILLSGEAFEYKYSKPQFDFYVNKEDEPQLFEGLLSKIKYSFGVLREELIEDLDSMVDIIADNVKGE